MLRFLRGGVPLFSRIPNVPKRLEEQGGLNGILLSFLLGLAVSGAIYLPFLVVDEGFFQYCGDFNSQQIPFYTYVQQFIKEGGGSWSWATDLGSSFVNSYSFYNLGSPFLWITLPFPTSWMPYLMVPLFMLKFACIAAAACLWLRRYSKGRNMAVIVSLVYAFCGFNVYNTFFNHMLDPVVFFPLMLWALDGFVYNGKRGWFALFVGLALLNSYFFFIGNVVFILLYFVVKLLTKEYRINLSQFGFLALEALIGVGIGMVLALPAFFNMLNNPRVDNFANGFGLVMYGNVQQYFAILSSMFLPPDPSYLPNIFPDAVIKWTSMSAFLPVVGMGGVIAYCRARRRGSTKVLLYISLVMALVPILNSAFYAFNASYYSRWFYMPILIMCLATMQSLEDVKIPLKNGARAVLIITAVIAVFGLLPTEDENGIWSLGVEQDTARFWLTMATAVLGALAFYLIVKFFRNKRKFAPLLLAAVMAFSVLYSIIHISLGKFPQWERDQDYVAEQYEGGALLAQQMPSDEFYRMDLYYSENAYDNLALWAGKSNLYTFNSTVTPSIMEFYPLVDVKRDVSSKPETDNYALRGLLNAKYVVMRAEDVSSYFSEDYTFDWVYYDSIGPFEVYQNPHAVPMGFTYDNYISMDIYEGIADTDRAAMLMRAIVLNDEQIAQYGHLFEGMAVDEEMQDGDMGVADGEEYYWYEGLNYDTYVQDAAERKATAAYEFSADSYGFKANIELEKDNLVFFSVPYDAGFTATVNGEKAEVLNVSGGMMAVQAPAGDVEIVFSYQTPGFVAGTVITICSLVALALYMLLCVMIPIKRYRRKTLPVDEVEQDGEGAQEASLLSTPDEQCEPTETANKQKEE